MVRPPMKENIFCTATHTVCIIAVAARCGDRGSFSHFYDWASYILHTATNAVRWSPKSRRNAHIWTHKIAKLVQGLLPRSGTVRLLTSPRSSILQLTVKIYPSPSSTGLYNCSTLNSKQCSRPDLNTTLLHDQIYGVTMICIYKKFGWQCTETHQDMSFTKKIPSKRWTMPSVTALYDTVKITHSNCHKYKKLVCNTK